MGDTKSIERAPGRTQGMEAEGPAERSGALPVTHEDPALGCPPGSRRRRLGGQRISRRTLPHLFRSRAQAVESAPDAQVGSQARRRDAFFRRGLALADVVAMVFALGVAVVVLGGDTVRPTLVLALPAIVLVSKVIGLYDRDEHILRKTTLDEAPALLKVATLSTLLIWLAEGALVTETTAGAEGDALGRDQVLGLWVLLFVSLLLARAGARQAVRAITPPERCLVLGNPESAEQVEKKFESAHSLDATVVGRVPLEPGQHSQGDGVQVVGQLDQLERLVVGYGIDRVIIAPATSDTEQLLDAIRMAKALGVKVSVLPRLFEVVGSSVRFDDVEGLMLLGVPAVGVEQVLDARQARRRPRSARASACSLLAPLLRGDRPGGEGLTSRGTGVLPPAADRPATARIFQMTQVPHPCTTDADEARRRSWHRAQRGRRPVQDRQRPPGDRRWGGCSGASRFDELPQLLQRAARRDEPGGSTPARAPTTTSRVEGWQRRRLDVLTGHDRNLAGPRLLPGAAPRDGQDRLPLRGDVVPVAGHEDPPADDSLRHRAQRPVARR